MADEHQPPPVRYKYKYNPIKRPRSIRLLHLHPSTLSRGPIEVSLHEFPLDDCPSFAALSYTWKSDDDDDNASLFKRLQCRGAVIDITKNCHAALWRLRQVDDTRVLWVDAVCIDQSNDDERGSQITLMRQIYSRAAWVGLWIGETSSSVDEETSTPLSDLGMDFIHDFAVEVAERSNSGQDVASGPLYQEFIRDRRAFHDQDPNVFTPRVQGLWDILHRKWWKRLWTVQELALSRSAVLMCGGKTEAFENLGVVIGALVRKGQSAEEVDFNTSFLAFAFHQFNMRNFLETDRHEDVSAPGEKALMILNATRNSYATDSRDKIYGILGFFGDVGSDPENIFPAPDYKKTAAELYAEVCRAIITSTGHLDVMSSCHGFVTSTVPDLPSWVAAWNDTPLQYFGLSTFNASGGSPVAYEDSGDGRLLRIKGRRVDAVKDASQPPGDTEYIHEACALLWRQWYDFALSVQSLATGEGIEDVLLDTLCWGNNLNLDRLAPGEYRETFDAWVKVLKNPEAGKDVARDLFEDAMAFTYSRRVWFTTLGRVLGATEKSYLAMLPISTDVGDDIVVFDGGRVPYVIRPQGEKFKLVGACYIHGIMDGEMRVEEDSASDKREWFTLC